MPKCHSLDIEKGKSCESYYEGRESLEMSAVVVGGRQFNQFDLTQFLVTEMNVVDSIYVYSVYMHIYV